METLSLNLAAQIATITLRRPSGNRINFVMREELRSAIGQVAASEATP